jgi:putative transposase
VPCSGAVTALRERFGVSERRACTVVGLHRSTMRLTPPPVTAEEAELRAWLRQFSTDRRQRRRKKHLSGISVAVGAMSPIRPNMIWAMDFQFDTTADGRTVKMLNVIDEFTREALAIEVDRAIDADGVVDVLDRLVLQHGAPYYVRFDNGPEFVAYAVREWCRLNSAGSLFIDPVSPWPNAWIDHLTVGCVMNCSTRGASTRYWKPA